MQRATTFIQRLLLFGLILGVSGRTTAQPVSTKLLAIEDLYCFDTPTAPALSPDGKNLAYVRNRSRDDLAEGTQGG